MAGPLVLVIADDEMFSTMLGDALGLWGYPSELVTIAESPRSTRGVSPDLILLEPGPPGGAGGGEVSARLRDGPATCQAPIIALVATTNRARYPGLAADEWLPMPFHLTDLCAAVVRWVGPA